MAKYIAPDKNKSFFTCPHCGICTQMETEAPKGAPLPPGFIDDRKNVVYIKRCIHCGKKVIWIDNEYVYPDIFSFEPNPDMPESVKSLYDEATLIYNKSPRAACALLRLAIERLCNELGETGKINEMIANLVRKGLRSEVQKALDAVRVIGNNAVHPGQIAFDVDDKATAEMLMKLLNIIIERMITESKEIEDIFENLPETVKQSIEKRDK